MIVWAMGCWWVVVVRGRVVVPEAVGVVAAVLALLEVDNGWDVW